jgi:hypothetical protein
MIAGATHLVGWVMLAAIVIPLADAVIVLRNGGSASVAGVIYGSTAAVAAVTAALLLTA